MPSTFDHSAYFILDQNHQTTCNTCHSKNNTLPLLAMVVMNILKEKLLLNIAKKEFTISVTVLLATKAVMNMT